MKITTSPRRTNLENRSPIVTVHKVTVPTPKGNFELVATVHGVAMVFFPEILGVVIERRMETYGLSFGLSGKQTALKAEIDLKDYLNGQKRQLSVPVDLSFYTPFKRDIYSALMSVPFGETITYGELAVLAGHPGKARAVGRAMGDNLAPIYIPCHRVVPASGGFGGWSGPRGWKTALLKLEGLEM
ncbi:MAG: methylated-DNA--[protein]-cysteine S-methyltransferase [Proteobacteria bacterium]|nr:methylated-DNA--[protein]-cysteine S-methyltransferase [Pseudomonadota bacterium]